MRFIDKLNQKIKSMLGIHSPSRAFMTCTYGEKSKQWFNAKNHKHEIIYKKGFGYRCKWCGKPKSQCK